MERQTFLHDFLEELEPLTEADRAQISEYYEELICDGLEQGLSEEECLARFGSPQEAAAKFREECMTEMAEVETSKKVNREIAETDKKVNGETNDRVNGEENVRMHQGNSPLSEVLIQNETIHTLDLRAGNVRIEVCPSESSEFMIRIPDTENAVVTNECINGVWYVTYTQNERLRRIGFFQFYVTENRPCEIMVMVPEDFGGSLLLQTTNGKICLRDIRSLSKGVFTTSNGAVDIENSEIAECEMKTSNGKIILDRFSGNLVSGNTSNARIEVRNCKIHSNIDLSTSNGKVVLDQIESDHISLHSSNGSITGTVKGDMREYATKAKTSNAKCNIPTVSYPDQKKTFSASTSNGKIDVQFTGNE